MVCLDLLRDEFGDALSDVAIGRELNPEFHALDPFHNGTTNRQRLRVSWNKHVQSQRHPGPHWHSSRNRSPVQRKILQHAFTDDPLPTLLHWHQFFESLIFSHDKPGHALSFLNRAYTF